MLLNMEVKHQKLSTQQINTHTHTQPDFYTPSAKPRLADGPAASDVDTDVRFGALQCKYALTFLKQEIKGQR